MTDLSTILLVEDNPLDARLVREYLNEIGLSCDLRTAASLAEAQQAVSRQAPDVILLDLGLPDSRGLASCVSLGRAAPHTPIVVLTGDDDEALAMQAMRVGAEAWLAKQDIDGSRLVRAMRHAIGRRQGSEAAIDRIRQEAASRNSACSAALDDLKGNLRRLARSVSEQRLAQVPKPLNRQPVDLGAMARARVESWRRQEPSRSVELLLDDDLGVQADVDLVDDLLNRLLDNAWKFSRMRSPARIELSAVRTSRTPVFRLRDNGIGFDMADAAGLFDPFRRLPSAQGLPGIGLGLSVARQAVERHGGRIWACSAPGAGATFYFTLEPAV
ncbi:ATP-binding protein [Leptothrix sp. BB-4]